MAVHVAMRDVCRRGCVFLVTHEACNDATHCKRDNLRRAPHTAPILAYSVNPSLIHAAFMHLRDVSAVRDLSLHDQRAR